MKKFTFIFIMMLGFASFSMAQTIENFETLKLNLFEQGTTGAISVVPNPDKTGANTSAYVGKMLRAKDGKRWMGWYATLPFPVDMTANKYVHIKVWKPRVSPTCFKVEKTDANSDDVFPIADATETGKWVELVYDFNTKPIVTGDYVKIVFIPDFEVNATDFPTLTEDITLYYDDFYVNNDPAVGSAPVKMMEDFEVIPMTVMLNDPLTDKSSVTPFTPNPDPSGVNISSYVLRFVRSNNGFPWCGFFSPTQVDVTTNKYAHVKVWKNRISPVKFKIEGGADGNLEVESMYPQTKVKAWEDMVFDFSTKTGTYPTIVFMPDFTDPVIITANDTMYIDDIIFNNNPDPIIPSVQFLQVNMGGYGLNPGDRVFVAGTFGGMYGVWVTPGTNPNNEMFDTDGDGIYTIRMQFPDGVTEFKFFVVPAGTASTWDFGDNTQPNRAYTFDGDANLIYIWGEPGFVTSLRAKPLAGKILMYPNPVSNVLTVNSAAEIQKVIITSTLGKVVNNLEINNSGVQTINTSGLSRGMYFVTFIGKDGHKVTQKLIKD